MTLKMETPSCYLEFNFPNDTIFNDLKAVFDKFKDARDNDSELNDQYWLEIFPEYAASQFWFLDTDIKPLNTTVVKTENSWHFYSLVELLYKNYEVDFVGLRVLSPNIGILEYDPYSYPYGGTDGFIAFLKSFTCIPTIVDDGTGLYKVEFNDNGSYSFADLAV